MPRAALLPKLPPPVAQLLYLDSRAGLARVAAEALGQSRPPAKAITGRLMAGGGLFLSYLEGSAADIAALWAQLERLKPQGHPKATAAPLGGGDPRSGAAWGQVNGQVAAHLVMSNPRGAGRLYPHAAMPSRDAATPLQMMAWVVDVRRQVNANAAWHLSLKELATLIDRHVGKHPATRARGAA